MTSKPILRNRALASLPCRLLSAWLLGLPAVPGVAADLAADAASTM